MDFETVDDWTRPKAASPTTPGWQSEAEQLEAAMLDDLASRGMDLRTRIDHILARDLATLTPGIQSNVDVRIDGLDVDFGPEP